MLKYIFVAVAIMYLIRGFVGISLGEEYEIYMIGSIVSWTYVWVIQIDEKLDNINKKQ